MSVLKRCRLGDLAMIVRSSFPQNRGRLVTIVARSGDAAQDWQCISEGRRLIGFVRGGPAVDQSHTINLRDEQLWPIRTDETPAQIRRLWLPS